MSFDTVAENAAFVEKEKFPFAILCDTDHEIGLAYGATDLPKGGWARRVTYVISPEGTIEQVIAKVDVTTHARTLLDSLPVSPSK